MGDLRLNEISYSNNGTGVLMLNGINYTGSKPETYTELTTSGSVASFDTNVKIPLKEAVFEITSSTSEVNVRVGGINFFNEDWEVGGLSLTTGLPNSETNKIRSATFSPCKGGETYYIKVGSDQNVRVLWYDSTQTFISVTEDIKNTVAIAPVNAAYLKFRGTINYGLTYKNDVSINLPVTDTNYHKAVAPSTRQIDIGSTVSTGSVIVNPFGVCYYDDGQGNVTQVDQIAPIYQRYGDNLIYCDTGDTEVTYSKNDGFIPSDNLWGGMVMAFDIARANPRWNGIGISNNNTIGRYITAEASAMPGTSVHVFDGPFKANTQYTFILKIQNDRVYGGDNVLYTNLRVHYTDGTDDNIVFSGKSANVWYTETFTSAAGKTIDYLYMAYQYGYSAFAVDECGIFEGVKTVDDFEPYNRYNM